MPMHAKDFKFEVGDMVVIVHTYGEREAAIITRINNGPEVNDVEVEFNDGSFGEYAPEDIMKGPEA